MPRLGEIKHICPNCNHIEKKTTGDFIVSITVTFIFVLGLVTFGVVIIVGPVGYMSFVSDAFLYQYAVTNAEELRSIAINHTTYEGSDTYYLAVELAKNIPHIRYVPASRVQPISDLNATLHEGGDCKNMAVVFVALANSIGIDAEVDSNLNERHSVVRVRDYERDTYLVIDLTQDWFGVYPKEVDHWDPNAEPISTYYINKDTDPHEIIRLD